MSPTDDGRAVAALRASLAAMSPERRAAVTAVLRERRGAVRAEAAPAAPPPVRLGATRAPLSFAQERLWFAEQVGPDAPTYHVPYAVPWPGPLDPTVLERALGEVVARHEALRTRFVTVDGAPVQEVVPAAVVEVEVVDVASWGEAEVARDTRAFAREPFDLASGSLLRARLLRRGPEDHVLLLVVHHIAADGWSVRVLFDELAVLHAAFAAGERSPLPDPAVQYTDFAVWQREWLRGGLSERQLSSWRGALDGAATVLELPTDRVRPAVRSGEGALLRFSLDPELAGGLLALARQRRATLFMILLAGFGVVLSRWSGREDLIIGTPVANRAHGELEGLIGFFANTLPLRVDLTGDPGFAELLDRVRDVSLHGFANQDVPFERLVEALVPQRSLNEAPLVQVVLALQSAGTRRTALGRSDLAATAVDTGVAKFDLTVALEETEDGGLSGAAEYDRDLFDEGTVARLAAHLETVLTAAVADPRTPVSRMPVLPEDERAWLLDRSTGLPSTAPASPVHELVTEWARATPDAPAVVAGDGRLTYAELEGRALVLARELRVLGARPGEVVGVCLPAGAGLVVAMLAVLHAGAAFLPLDPDQPTRRLGQMVDSSDCRLVVVRGATGERLPPHVGTLDLAVVDEPDTRSGRPCGVLEPPAARASVDDLAYVISTSGSTGTPKGVAVAHAALLNLLADTRRRDPLPPGAPCSLWSSPSFDVSIWELWTALTTGGTLHVVPEDGRLDPDDVLDFLTDREIVSGFLPAHVLPGLADALEAGRGPRTLRRVLTGVEPIPGELLHRIVDALPGLRVWNAYGPTEATVYLTAHDVRGGPRVAGPAPVGGPIDGAVTLVLDPNRRLVPIGVPGELHIGGACLARGYLGDPERTGERFVPNPFAPLGGPRLYRTGDLARWRPDGTLAILGRIDRQLKVRGHRIEPGEIEAVLRSLPEVADAVVLVPTTGSGAGSLTACVVPAGGSACDEDALRRQLVALLPRHMVPESLVPVAGIARGANGKVDAVALGDAISARLDGRPAAPPDSLTPFEAQVAEVWADVLGRPVDRPDDDFFAVGGNSLQATRVVPRIRERFGVDYTVRALFDATTVRECARAVAEAPRSTGAPAITRRPRRPVPGPISADAPRNGAAEGDARAR